MMVGIIIFNLFEELKLNKNSKYYNKLMNGKLFFVLSILWRTSDPPLYFFNFSMTEVFTERQSFKPSLDLLPSTNPWPLSQKCHNGHDWAHLQQSQTPGG